LSAEPRQATPTLAGSPPDADDPVGRCFAAHHQLGDHMGIRFGRLAPSSAEPQWLYMPHWRYDGVGGFAELLRERGAAKLERLPEMKKPDRPGLWRHLQAVLRLQRRVQKLQPWHIPDAAWLAPGSEQPRGSAAIGYRVLSRESTAALRRRARELSISVNSLLLWGLDPLARATWLLRTAAATDWSKKETQWMVPVNLRGGISLRRDTANHLGLMDVLLAPAATPAQVHAALRSELAQGAHWAAWRVLTMTRFLSPRGLSAVVQKEAERGVVHTGLFSNLGDWDPDERSPEAEAKWLFCPQVTRKIPVAAGAVCWAGQLALTLQIHPMFAATDELVSEWAGRWVELLERAG
jgi:hypothetical protein